MAVSRRSRAPAARKDTRAASASASKAVDNTNGSNAAAKKKDSITTEAKTDPSAKKRKRSSTIIKEEEEDDDQDVASDSALSDPPSDIASDMENAESDSPAPKGRAKRQTRKTTGSTPKDVSKPDLEAGAAMASKLAKTKDESASPPPAKKARGAKSTTTAKDKSKANPYGLTPGTSPYPDYPHPTPEECYEVDRILSATHGRVVAPKSIPTPSLSTSGCGEVPSVLDALIRTRLSANTNGANSNRAFRGLVERFGVVQEGVGKGSVDWDKVRRAKNGEVFEAIKSGGLASVKSRDIQNILQMVWDENVARRDALVKGETEKVEGVKEESAPEAQGEIEKADDAILSLDHLHLLSTDDAFAKLVTYPGIGPKTASCVLLFCLQRPSFAVDTHVFRLTKWLGWVPRDKATRNSTYAHLDVKIPDELKYSLHYLLIKHGKMCAWCSAKASAKDRAGKKCPIAHLVVREGAGRKKSGGGSGGGAAKKGKKKKATAGASEDEEEEEDDMSVEESAEEDEVSLNDDDEDENGDESSVKDEEEDEEADEEVHNLKVERPSRQSERRQVKKEE